MKTGLHKRNLRFDAPLLQGQDWPVIDIIGAAPGPHLAVMAGVHVSEVSSIEAAIRLPDLLNLETLRGRISILPVVDVEGAVQRSLNLCLRDGKNIGLCFPGDPTGSYSEVLAHAILHDWAADADCLIDLHAADLSEEMTSTVTWQKTGDAQLDALSDAYAACFDARNMMVLPPDMMQAPGRSCTGWAAAFSKPAVYSVAGEAGRLRDRDIQLHIRGVLRVARAMGILRKAQPKRSAPARRVTGYDYVPAPLDGLCYLNVALGDEVRKGQEIGQMRNLFGEVLATLTAPRSGWILFRDTHLFAPKGRLVFGVGNGPETN